MCESSGKQHESSKDDNLLMVDLQIPDHDLDNKGGERTADTADLKESLLIGSSHEK